MTMLGGTETIMGDSSSDDKIPDKVPAKAPEVADDKAPAATGSGNMLHDLIGLKKEEITLADMNTRQMQERVHRDRAQMDEAFKREQYAAGSMPAPWDAEQEHEKRTRGPYESFGSVATVFAMFASLATRTPLTSALNAGASAMNAMHQSDEKSYERAYQAFKDNAERTVKQFNVERQVFDDTQRLMSSDVTAWRATQMANEARFGNRKALYLLENGMDKEYLEAKTSQIKASEMMHESIIKADMFDAQHRMFSETVKQFEQEHPDTKPAEKMQFRLNTLKDIGSGQKTAEMQVYTDSINQYWRENGHEPPPEWKTQKLKEVMGARYGSRAGLSPASRIALRIEDYMKPEAEGGLGLSSVEALTRAEQDEKRANRAVTTEYQDQSIELRKQEHADRISYQQKLLEQRVKEKQARGDSMSASNRIKIRAEEYQKPVDEGGLGLNRIESMTKAERDEKAASASPTAGNLTLDRQVAGAAAKHKEELKKEHPEWTNEQLDEAAMKYAAKLKTTAAAPSGNRVDDIKGKLNQVRMAKELTNHVEEMLKTHGAIAGLAGSVTRTAEVLGNILGSSQTDRKQFQRWVQEMQEIAPRILLDTKGRPLGSEAGRINGIIAGLSPGDTGPNTIRAWVEFHKVLDGIQKDLEGRIGGASSEAAPAAKDTGDNQWWKSPDAGAVVH